MLKIKVKCQKCEFVYWVRENSEGKCCMPKCDGILMEYMGTRFDDYEAQKQMYEEETNHS